MAGKMADYLPQKTADYTITQLTISPQRTLVENPNYAQQMNVTDSGIAMPTSLDSDPYYTVQLQWDVLDQSDAETIIDMFADPNKAKGILYTFEWPHPTDGKTYIVRFNGSPKKELSPGTKYAVPKLTLRVEGYK